MYSNTKLVTGFIVSCCVILQANTQAPPTQDFVHNTVIKMMMPYLQAIESSLLGSLSTGLGLNETELVNSTSWPQCERGLSAMQAGVSAGTPWALKMLDASAKLGSGILKGNLKFMGNYKQCDQVAHSDGSLHIQGNVCRMYIQLPFPIFPPDLVPFTPPVQWDICVPKTCKGDELTIAANKAFARYDIRMGISCTQDVDVSNDTRAIAAITILSLFAVLLVAGTLMEVYITFWKSASKYGATDQSSINNGAPENTSTTCLSLDGKNIGQEDDNSPGKLRSMALSETSNKLINEERRLPQWQRVLLAFSIPRSTGKILDVGSARGNIGCLHGLRVFSLGWVILGHTVFFGVILGNFSNTMYALTEIVPSYSFTLIVGAYFAVDTFFVLSGFLTCYVFLKKLGDKGTIKAKEIILYYVHRYWRLTPSLAIWIMVVACLMDYVGDGRPNWQEFSTHCRDTWWTNLLYINNLYRHDEGCVGVTWYLACDMQYYVIAPLVLIPWLFGKKILGFIMAAALLCVHIFSMLGLELKYPSDNTKNQPDYDKYIYFKSYTRVGPYAIGLMLGWILWKTKCKVRMNKYIAFLGWLVCLSLLLVLVLVKYEDLREYPKPAWSDDSTIAYQTLSRPVWAMAICWVIFACATGHGGYVNSILSWGGWLPLSRLSYSAYLVHLTIITFEAGYPEYIVLMTKTAMAYTYIGYFVMTNVVAYLLTVVVESPALGLEKAILG